MRRLAPGTQIPLGYWNQITQQWEHAGTGIVDNTGQWIEMQVVHFSNYDCNDPLALGGSGGSAGITVGVEETVATITQGVDRAVAALEVVMGRMVMGRSGGGKRIILKLPLLPLIPVKEGGCFINLKSGTVEEQISLPGITILGQQTSRHCCITHAMPTRLK